VVNLNVAVYVDYENIYKRLKDYSLHPIRDLNFFEVLSKKLKEANLNIIKFVSFSNFEDSDFSVYDQTLIRNYGVDVRHCSVDSKSSTDTELIIEVISDVYKNPQVDMFVLVSNDRDYVPLLQAIKLNSKKTYSLSTKNGFNEVVNVFADHHQYIEDLFQLEEEQENDEYPLADESIRKAKQVADMLYTSSLWSKYEDKGEKVTLKGYVSIIHKFIWKKESKADIEKYFRIANGLEYVLIDDDGGSQLFLLEGKKRNEIYPIIPEKSIEVEN
jgi:uncharacterized LabA/DUF88 family protein